MHYITTLLQLDDGETFALFQPSMEVEALREQFADAIEREYYVDFPERKPTDSTYMAADPLAAYIESKGIRCP